MRSKTKKSSGVLALPVALWQFYRRYAMPGFRKLLYIWAFALMFNYAGAIFGPYMERLIIRIFENSSNVSGNLLLYALPTILGVVVLHMFCSSSWLVENTLWSHTEPKIKQRISETLTTYVHDQSMGFWVNKMAGSINSQIGYIADGFSVFFMLFHVIGTCMIILVNGGMLINLNKYVAGLFVIAIISRGLYAWHFKKRVKKSSENASSAGSTLNGKMVDSFSNYSIVKYFAGAQKEKQSLVQYRSNFVNLVMVMRYAQRLFWALPMFLWDILFGCTIALCLMLYQRGQMQIADVVYTMSVYYFVMDSINRVIKLLPDMIEYTGKAKKAYKELVMPISVVDKPNAPDLVVKKGLIEFKHIVFGYRNRPVLTDLMLRIKPGERVGIVGSSGAGKTTLVNLLMRFYEQKQGQILIDGQDIADVKQDSLRSQIAFIPQDPAMFNRTIAENIGYGKFGASKAEIRKAAKIAAADEFIMETNKKYNSLVGDKGIKLSGGQRQRIAIARAFLKDAPILVLDEATSALDSETEVAIQESFEKLSKGRTTIAIAHRLSTLRNMDRIIVLDKGVIIERGTHQQLLRRKGKYHQLWQMQSGGFLQEEKHK